VIGCGGIVVIGLVATLVVPRVLEKFEHAGADKARADIEQLTNATIEYATRNSGAFPESLEQLWTPDADGYRYIASEPRDPWGHAYEYRTTEGDDWPLVFSRGPDGAPNTHDDVYGEDAFDVDDEPDESDPEARMQADMEELTTALNEFAIRNNGSYPAALEVLWRPDSSGAKYIDRDTAPRDAWGNEYEYRLPSAEGEDPLVFSVGPDGVADTADDFHADEDSDVEDEEMDEQGASDEEH
jgi:general secretion pathway protein G